MKKITRDGFTLLELMIVVMIIGILAGVATAKYASLYRKAEEGGVQGNLGAAGVNCTHTDSKGGIWSSY